MGKSGESSHDKLYEKLAALGAERLARFVATLAQDDEGIGQKVELLLALGSGPETVKLLRKRVAGLARIRGYVGYGESFGFGRELSDLLDAVEEKLVRDDPAAAVELLGAFLRTDSSVFEHADDSGVIGGEYRRACALFADAASRLKGAPDLPGRVCALLQEDGYGVRHDLLQHAARYLSAESIYAMAEKWMRQAKAIPETPDAYAHRGFLVKVQTLAESLRDPELYEKAAFFDRDAKGFPVIAMKVASQYLAAGRAAEAFEKLPPEAEVPAHFRHDYQEILAGIFEQLGHGEELQALRWKIFCDAPSEATAKDYLEILPAAGKNEARQRMREQVQTGSYSPQQKALYFAEQKDFDAAKYVIEHPSAFDGNLYGTLAPLAAALETPQPLAATVLYRALIEAILARSLSKYYPHAVRYLRKTEAVANTVKEWDPVAPHSEYVAELQETHKRKTAFWSRLAGETKGGPRGG